MNRLALLLILVAACGDNLPAPPDIGPAANAARDITATALDLDVTALSGTATLTFAPSTSPGASAEVGDLAFQSVTVGGHDLAYAIDTSAGSDAGMMTLALPVSTDPIDVTFTYTFAYHEKFTGASATGYTLVWPNYCGNVFPCHSIPRDGTTFTLNVTGVPAGQTIVYPQSIAAPAPSYQIAYTYDNYHQLDFGSTTAGTLVSAWYIDGQNVANVMDGFRDSVGTFDWLEQTLGPYQFGNHVGGVAVRWPAGELGGMEHHPFWHDAKTELTDIETNVHESAHGWFGDGIRIGCWEDFLLSEGTVNYLTGRSLDVIDPVKGASIWAEYKTDLTGIPGTDPVYPDGCTSVDPIKDNFFTDAPYIRGALFYKALADKLGPEVVDGVLAAFYKQYVGQSAHMSDMLDMIQSVTGYDPTACAQTWLKSTTRPTYAACP